MNKLRIYHLLQFVLFMALQLLLIRNLVLFDTGFCFIYIAFILFLPIGLPVVLLLFFGFITGFTADIFYDTGGIHAAATVLLAYLRPWVLKLLTPRDGYDSGDTVNLHRMGWRWFMVYAFFLIFLHHFALFFLELGNMRFFGFTILKVIFSTFFTGIIVLIVQLLFFSAKRVTR
jgi:hypothetical protein